MFGFANPTRFLKLSRMLKPVLGGLGLILMMTGLYYGLFNSPADYLQGENVRIMYIHVPAAWVSLFLYASLAIAGVTLIGWKHRLAEFYIRSAAFIGTGFALMCLITGSIWGYPTWGTWWVWDARLTSMLILFLLYMGIILLQDAFEDSETGGKAAAYLAIIGSINLPIIKFSVEWWQTLHQPASISSLRGLQNPKIDDTMLTPLLCMAGAFFGLAGYMILKRMENQIALAKTANTQRKVQKVKIHEESA